LDLAKKSLDKRTDFLACQHVDSLKEDS